MVTPQTTRALVVVFAPREVDERHLRRVLELTAQRMSEFTGGAATFLQ
jgi:DNA/RNA-binding domain of Phe-tRNA-synthetase-like protein